jgi:hypothetical protein
LGVTVEEFHSDSEFQKVFREDIAKASSVDLYRVSITGTGDAMDRAVRLAHRLLSTVQLGVVFQVAFDGESRAQTAVAAMEDAFLSNTLFGGVTAHATASGYDSFAVGDFHSQAVARTATPTRAPTPTPTLMPTAAPTFTPSEVPTPVPTASPTFSPTPFPSPSPTFAPTTTPPYVKAVVPFNLDLQKDAGGGAINFNETVWKKTVANVAGAEAEDVEVRHYGRPGAVPCHCFGKMPFYFSLFPPRYFAALVQSDLPCYMFSVNAGFTPPMSFLCTVDRCNKGCI